MKLEFFADGSPDGPLLLLYGKAPDTVRALARELGALKGGQLELETFPGIEAVGGCRVVAKVTRRDLGIRQVGPTSFVWELSPAGWEQAIGLMEPFTEGSSGDGFQWLLRNAPDISFIISGGRWW